MPVIGHLHVRAVRAYDLIKADMFGESDPFLKATLGGQTVRSKTKNNDPNPCWNEDIGKLDVTDDGPTMVTFSVWDDDGPIKSPDPLGSVDFDLEAIFEMVGQEVPFRQKLEGVDSGELEVVLKLEELPDDDDFGTVQAVTPAHSTPANRTPHHAPPVDTRTVAHVPTPASRDFAPTPASRDFAPSPASRDFAPTPASRDFVDTRTVAHVPTRSAPDDLSTNRTAFPPLDSQSPSLAATVPRNISAHAMSGILFVTVQAGRGLPPGCLVRATAGSGSQQTQTRGCPTGEVRWDETLRLGVGASTTLELEVYEGYNSQGRVTVPLGDVTGQPREFHKQRLLPGIGTLDFATRFAPGEATARAGRDTIGEVVVMVDHAKGISEKCSVEVKLRVSGVQDRTTECHRGGPWRHQSRFWVDSPLEVFFFHVVGQHEQLGELEVPLSMIASRPGESLEITGPLVGCKYQPRPSLHVVLAFFPAARASNVFAHQGNRMPDFGRPVRNPQAPTAGGYPQQKGAGGYPGALGSPPKPYGQQYGADRPSQPRAQARPDRGTHHRGRSGWSDPFSSWLDRPDERAMPASPASPSRRAWNDDPFAGFRDPAETHERDFGAPSPLERSHQRGGQSGRHALSHGHAGHGAAQNGGGRLASLPSFSGVDPARYGAMQYATQGARPQAPDRFGGDLSRGDLGRGDLGRGDPSRGKSRGPSKLRVMVVRASNLVIADVGFVSAGSSDPYVILKIGRQKHQTTVIKTNLNPVWNEEFVFDFTDYSDVLKVEMWDWDMMKTDDPMGDLKIPLRDLQRDPSMHVSQPLSNVDHGRIELVLQLE